MTSFLRARGIVYDIKGGEDALPVKCSCFLNVDPASAKTLVVHMARTAPLFGNLCVEDEMLHRNRIFTKLDFGTCESWVGRDIRKYLPGLYWLTVVSETLAEEHGVPLSKVGTSASNEVVFENGRHLFQFYDHPNQWREHRRAMDALCSVLPGGFSIDVLPARITGPITYPELLKMREPWR